MRSRDGSAGVPTLMTDEEPAWLARTVHRTGDCCWIRVWIRGRRRDGHGRQRRRWMTAGTGGGTGGSGAGGSAGAGGDATGSGGAGASGTAGAAGGATAGSGAGAVCGRGWIRRPVRAAVQARRAPTADAAVPRGAQLDAGAAGRGGGGGGTRRHRRQRGRGGAAAAGLAGATGAAGHGGAGATGTGGAAVGPTPDPATRMICTGTDPIACHFGGQPGNYDVTVVLGGAAAGNTIVQAETLRAMLGATPTAAGARSASRSRSTSASPRASRSRTCPAGTPGLDLYFLGNAGAPPQLARHRLRRGAEPVRHLHRGRLDGLRPDRSRVRRLGTAAAASTSTIRFGRQLRRLGRELGQLPRQRLAVRRHQFAPEGERLGADPVRPQRQGRRPRRRSTTT